MPIPRGSHYVPGNPNRVVLGNGETVTRSHARTLGAREIGYKSQYAYTKSGRAAGDTKNFNAWLRSDQGQRAKAIAANSNKTVSQLKQEFLAARNARPHASGRIPGTPGKSGGSAYYEFMEEYDMHDQEDWIDY
jgi:hypothetical protein